MKITGGFNSDGLPFFMIGGLKADHTSLIREIKKEHDLTTEEISSIIGVSKRTIDGWLIGRGISTAHQLKILKMIKVI